MHKTQRDTISSILSVILLAATLPFSSCAPEHDGPNPHNYELFVDQRDQHPAFSPDGNLIAYYHFSSQLPEPADYPSGLYIIDKEGNNRTLVLEGHHYNPAWSPDGEWLVFSSGGLIQKCKINGAEVTIFSGLNYLDNPQFYFPDWSSNGSYIIFGKPFAPDGGLYFTTSDFSAFGRPFGMTIETGSQPRFSPSVNSFIFCKGDQSFKGGIELFLFDTLELKEVRLTHNNGEDQRPTWSPDGSKIAWSSDVRVHTMNADGSSQKFLAYGQFPSWSINNEIVFSHANAGYTKEVLYVIKPDGSGKRQITE